MPGKEAPNLDGADRIRGFDERLDDARDLIPIYPLFFLRGELHASCR